MWNNCGHQLKHQLKPANGQVEQAAEPKAAAILITGSSGRKRRNVLKEMTRK